MKKTQITFLIIFCAFGIINAQDDSKAIKLNNEAYELLSQGKYNEAIIGFNNAIKIDSNFYMAYQNRAYTYSVLENDSFAIKDYIHAIKLNPDIADMYYSLANIYQKQNLTEQAYNNYTLAINTAVKNNDKSHLYIYYFNRGNNLLESERYKESIADFDSTEKANSNYNDLFLNRGISKYKIKDTEGACLDWFIAKKADLPNAKKYFEKNCGSFKINKYLQLPEFPGGMLGFKKYIAQNLNYPVDCRNNGLEGTVYIRFSVNENGSLSILDARSFAHQDLITEAMNVVLSTEGKWLPGSINGKKVKLNISIPITFKLGQGDNKSYKKKAYNFFEKGNYKEAKINLHRYLLLNYDTIASNDYIKIKYLLNDTADIEYYKYIIGKSDKKPDYLKKYLNNKSINNQQPVYFSTKPQSKPNLTKTLYYNKIYELTDKEHASFYRITTWNPNILFFDSSFTDFNKNNDTIHSGSYSKGYKEGSFKLFYDTNLLYAEGKYKKNKMSGLWKYYYKNGQTKDEVVIIGNEFKIINHYSEQGDTLVKIGTGKWTYKIESYDGKNDMYVSGNLVNGNRDGLWTIRNDEKNIVEEQYEKGKFITGKYYEKRKAKKITEPLITSWIFINTSLERMGSLIAPNLKIKEYYPFIKFIY